MSTITILEQLESVSSRLVKEAILRENIDDKCLLRVFIFALDPYSDYGIKKFKRNTPVTDSIVPDDHALNHFMDILELLKDRTLKGNKARFTIENCLSRFTEKQQKWCERILLRNLRCGVQDSTVNKVWPNSIVAFSVSLAKTLNVKHDKTEGLTIIDELDYPKRIEPKLDGLRLIAIKHNGIVTMYTRNGTQLDTLPQIKNTLELLPCDDIVFDGEAMAKDWNESASVLMAHKNKKDDSNVVYHIFDCMNYQDWIANKCKLTFSERWSILTNLLQERQTQNVVLVSYGYATNADEVIKAYQHWIEQGFEGVMIKDINAMYQFKRSSAILKMKPIQTWEGVIVDTFDGRESTRLKGQFGGLNVLLSNGTITRVGSGFDDKFRKNVDRTSLIGKIVEFEGQPDPTTTDGLTVDGRVRFPVFLRFRDERDVDQKILEAYKIWQETLVNVNL